MPVLDLATWIDTFAKEGTIWCEKRLSANDTFANESHQAGPYLPMFIEERLAAGKHFSHGAVVDETKRPDPSAVAYGDSNFPAEKLRMLATKTTCKDRWRQILNEASRIKKKHLLTLQEGLSANQFKEMVDENVQLVVPLKIQSSYHSYPAPPDESRKLHRGSALTQSLIFWGDYLASIIDDVLRDRIRWPAFMDAGANAKLATQGIAWSHDRR